MSWLDKHLEEFVYPKLGEENDPVFLQSVKNYRENPDKKFFSNEELSVIKSIWRVVKREAAGKTLILPGRDVFIFEILARRENYPTVFFPKISRLTVGRFVLPKDSNKYFIFDTGFIGTIPRKLGVTHFKLLSYSNSENKFESNPEKRIQVFPRLSWSRGLALKIESTPKYWKTARKEVTWEKAECLSEKKYIIKIRQDFSSPEEFARAAKLTIEIYTNSAPRFINKHTPLHSGATI